MGPGRVSADALIPADLHRVISSNVVAAARAKSRCPPMFAAHEGARAVPRDHYYSNGGPHSSDISFNFQTLLRRGDGAWCIWLSLYKYAQCEYVMLSLALFGVALGGHGQGAPQE